MYYTIAGTGIFSRSHDKFVGISQRFNKTELIKELEIGFGSTDMRIENIRYRVFLLSIFIFLVSIRDKIYGVAKKSDLKKVPVFINTLLYYLQLVDDRIFSFAPWGSSLYVLLKKPKAASAKTASTY
ncbi:MAG: hypothetical protein M9962_06230 [Oligoflexia bacterium]|nr:hypothetical protein [Oligoflexia bacterium]